MSAQFQCNPMMAQLPDGALLHLQRGVSLVADGLQTAEGTYLLEVAMRSSLAPA